MATQGVGTYAINSFWESGRLIFYEKASGHTTTGNVFILGADYVQVGDTANDVNFVWKGDTTGTFTLDAGAHTLALTGMATSTDGAVTITNATATSSTTTGALIVTGGIATAADIFCGDDLFFASTGVINFAAGNVTITHATGGLTCNGALTLSIATESTSTTTGALIVAGGIGFAGDMYVGDDIFMAATGVINFGAGDITITGGTNTLAFAGASSGVTFDGLTTVTVASLNATTGRIAKFDGTVLTPNFGDGYGAVEVNLNIGTGAVAGHVAAMSSWINLNAATTMGSLGNCISPLDVGIYAPSGTFTNGKFIMGLKMSCVIDNGANPGELYLFNTNIFSNATTALFDINTIVDLTATATAAATGGYKLPFCKERSTGTTWYMNIYTS